MEDEDLVVILANLLNNAIEACENCIGKKVIKFKFMMEEQMIILSVKNTCNQMIIYHNNEIATTKMINQDEHGVGIKNIIRIVEKYNGEYVIQNDEDLFNIFSNVLPAGTLLKNIAKILNLGVIEIEVGSQNEGILAAITKIKKKKGINIRQAYAEDNELEENPNLTVITENPIDNDLISEFLKIKGVNRVSIY